MSRKIRYDRLIVISLSIAVLLFALSGLLHLFRHGQTTPSATVKSTENSTLSRQVDLLDYKLYEDEHLDFRFAIVRFRFRDKTAVHDDLSQFVTEENIALNKVNDYVKKLEESSLFLGKENVVFTVNSNQREVTASLFVPYKKQGNELLLQDKRSQKTFRLDLRRDPESIEILRNRSNQDIHVGDTVFHISDSFISDRVSFEGHDYGYPSSVQIYTYQVEVKSLAADSFLVESASFIANGSKEEILALGQGYKSIRKDLSSLVGQILHVGDQGALMFEVYSPNDETIDMNGVIRLKLKGIEKPIEILSNLK